MWVWCEYLRCEYSVTEVCIIMCVHVSLCICLSWHVCVNAWHDMYMMFICVWCEYVVYVLSDKVGVCAVCMVCVYGLWCVHV